MKYGDQWVGYDDPISVKLKMAYIQNKNLGGVSLWALDLDDFQVRRYKFSTNQVTWEGK